MNVGQYIKGLRTRKGISQEELGKIVGVKRAAVQKWECGTVTNLKRSTIKKLADYFGVSPASFVVDNISEYPGSQPDKYPMPNITEEFVTFPIIGDIAAGYDHTINEDWLELISINPNYPPGRIENESLEHCRILGIPWFLMRTING